MTQDGETEGYTASDHLRALYKHSHPGIFDICLANSTTIPPLIAQKYALEGEKPLLYDTAVCEALGVEMISRPVAMLENGLIRHNSGHLARELMDIYQSRRRTKLRQYTPKK